MADEQLKYLTARLTLDTSSLDQARQRIGQTREELGALGRVDIPAEGKLQKLRSAADDLGKAGAQLSTKITLPLVAVGAAATKLAVDFDSSFAKMRGLAGVTADEVDGLKKSVLGLASETGRGPQELADALYFARSAGLSAADALDTVRTAAKASAAGLGESKTIVDAVTSAIGAYGSANLTASRAGDILVASARAAKIEASELAPQLGRLLPTAQSLGVGFDQVAGAMAFLSQKSGDASLSATQLDSVMRKLLIPSTQGKKALDEVGLSADALRKTVSEQGLIGVLDLLRSKFGNNIDALGRVFDDVQALQGAQLLLSDSTGNLAGILDSTARSAGALDDAYGAVADTAGFKTQKAIAELKVALIQIGDALLPLLGLVADFVSTVVGGFSKLPTPVLDALLAFGALAAALGPLLSVGSNIVKTFDLVRSGLTKLATAFTNQAAAAAAGATETAAAGSVLGPLGIAVAGVTGIVTLATIAFSNWSKSKKELKDQTNGLIDAFGKEEAAVRSSIEAVVEKRLQDHGQVDDLVHLGVSLKTFTDATLGSADAQEEVRRRLIATHDAHIVLANGTELAGSALANLEQQFIKTGTVAHGAILEGNTGLVASLDSLTQSSKDAATAQLDHAEVIGALTKAERGQIEAEATAKDGTIDYNAELDRAQKAIDVLRGKTGGATSETSNLGDATSDTTGKLSDAAGAAYDEAGAIDELTKRMHDQYDATVAMLDPTLASEQANRRVQEALEKVDEATAKVAKSRKKDLPEANQALTDSELAARDVILQGADAFAQSEAKQHGFKDAADDSIGSMKNQITYLEGIRDKLAPNNPLRAYLDQYIEKLTNGIPAEVHTKLLLQLEAVLAPLRVAGKIVNSADALERMLPQGAAGAFVNAPLGTPVPMIVHGGEVVVPAETIRAAQRAIVSPADAAHQMFTAQPFQMVPGVGPAQPVAPVQITNRFVIGDVEIRDVIQQTVTRGLQELTREIKAGVRF